MHVQFGIPFYRFPFDTGLVLPKDSGLQREASVLRDEVNYLFCQFLFF